MFTQAASLLSTAALAIRRASEIFPQLTSTIWHCLPFRLFPAAGRFTTLPALLPFSSPG